MNRNRAVVVAGLSISAVLGGVAGPAGVAGSPAEPGAPRGYALVGELVPHHGNFVAAGAKGIVAVEKPLTSGGGSVYDGVYCFDLEFTPTRMVAIPQAIGAYQIGGTDSVLVVLPGPRLGGDFAETGELFEDSNGYRVTCDKGFRDAAVVTLRRGTTDHFSAVYVTFF